MPDRWAEAVRRWSEHNEQHRTEERPDRNTEYLLYQTLVGAWPIDAERLTAYMIKATRESRQQTTWTSPNGEFESVLEAFIAGILGDGEFIADLSGFVDTLRTHGWVSALSQALLKLTAPGVPDIYQGCDLWDLSLVDPDNRRPVDYALRQRLLGDLEHASPEDIWARRDEGLPKLWVLRQALEVRREHGAAFGPRGQYEPLTTHGAKAQHLVAFLRGGEAVTLAPRLVVGLADDWADTTVELPEGRWRNTLTGEEYAGGALALTDALRRFPVALLVKVEGAES
jgi:(1->4)-alpha-D-glucan 1-alpha-D-glucosylmutase